MIKQKKAYIYAISAVILWSTAASAFKITLRYIKPISMLFYSSLTALIALSIILLIQRKSFIDYSKKEILNSAILGLLNPFAYYIILFKAYSLLPAQLAQPLNFIWPLMIVLFSIPILKQKITYQSILSIFTSFVGVVIISTKGRIFDLRFDSPLGIFLALFSSIIWALFFIFNIKDKRDEISKLFLSFVFGVIFTAIIYLPNFHIPHWKGLLGSVYIGLFEMGITFIIWIRALKLSRTTAEVNNLIYLTPFISLLFISFVVGEKILFSTIIGLILIISGIILQQKFKRS